MDWATTNYGFNAYTSNMIGFCRVVVATLLAFVMFGVVIFVLVNSNKRPGESPYIG